MRILVHTSNWAIWARRLGSFALPLAIVPVLMHRAGAIGATPFEVVAAVAIAVAVLALVVSLGAFVRLWTTGDRGWDRAVIGLVCGILCLAPVALVGFDYFTYPIVDEVSTDPANPPPLVSNVSPAAAAPAAAARIAAAFPNVRTRNYPLDTPQIFTIVDKLVTDRGWQVIRRHAPDDEDGNGQINAIAMTLFGFRDEVSVRLTQTDDGTSVAMRSTSLSPLHEPGANGSRIEAFLTALDDQITQLQKDQPAGTAEDDDTDQTAPPVPAPLPRGRKR